MLIRQPVVAGTFYDNGPNLLRKQVEETLQQAACALRNDAQAKPKTASMIMLPHAGHMYCADVIAATLTRVRLHSTLILLCPNHTGAGSPLAVWPKGQWLTPLGPIPVNEELASSLISCDCGFTADTTAHMREHSLEVLLPFLQIYVPQLSIVPICVGNLHMSHLKRAGNALASIVLNMRTRGQHTSMVLSSDMNHFADHENTCRLDAMALAHLLEIDPDGLAHTVIGNNISMCGIFPAIIALCACKSMNIHRSELVKHSTSGLQNGDWSRVVGYAGLFAAENILPNVKKDA